MAISELRQSPTTGIRTLTFLWMDVGSMSIWTMVALGAKEERRPVTRSSKRTPTAIRRSALLTALLAA